MNIGGQILTMQRAGANPLESGVPPEVVSADPTVAPLSRAPGTTVLFGTTYYWQGGTLASPQWWLFPSARPTLEEVWRARASKRLGVTPSQLLFDFHLLGTHGDIAAGGNTPIVTTGTGVRSYLAGGYYRISSGGATGTCRWIPGLVGGNSPLPVAVGAATKFWVGFRAKFPTIGALGANAFGLVGMNGGASSINCGMGFHGATSAANVVVFGAAGVTFSTGVALDNNPHDFEFYRADGATTVPYIDDVITATGNARPSADGGLIVDVEDNVGALRQMDLVWVALAVVRS